MGSGGRINGITSDFVYSIRRPDGGVVSREPISGAYNGYFWIKFNPPRKITENRSITMCVVDDAGGIPDDILPHIFQPGFSTKFDEQTGMPSPGLGLCHVRDIVNKWNAQISVESRVPEGTTFRVDILSL